MSFFSRISHGRYFFLSPRQSNELYEWIFFPLSMTVFFTLPSHPFSIRSTTKSLLTAATAVHASATSKTTKSMETYIAASD